MAIDSAKDLTRGFPRSPAEELGGYVLLARIIDKCRATINGTNGEYKYNCPLDRQFFDFADVDAEELKNLIEKGASDEQVAQWVRDQDTDHSDMARMTWCFEQRNREPQSAEQKAYFEKLRRSACPDKLYVRTWMQVLDSEEGRI